MFPLREDSCAAAFLLMMLTLDTDGVRKQAEFDMVASCLVDLDEYLSDGADESSAEALMPILNMYYDEMDSMTSDEEVTAYLDGLIAKIVDPALRRNLFLLMMRVAIADDEFHAKENELLERVGNAWGLPSS